MKCYACSSRATYYAYLVVGTEDETTYVDAYTCDDCQDISSTLPDGWYVIEESYSEIGVWCGC